MDLTRDWFDYVTAGVAVLGFVGAVVSLFLSARSNSYAKKANDHADRANEIAQGALEFASKYEIPWKLGWDTGDTYKLVNTGSDDEFEVEVSIPGAYSFRANQGEAVPVVNAKGSITFLASFAMGGSRQVTVTWARKPGGEKLTWQDELPHRPRTR